MGSLGRWDVAILALQELAKDGGEAELCTDLCNVALSACEQGHQWRTALDFEHLMEERCIARNDTSLRISLTACDKGQQWRQAHSVFAQMASCSSGSMPDANAYSTYITICCKSQQWQQALKLLQDMYLQSLVASGSSYTAVISACERNRQWQEALELLREMPARGV